MKLFTDSSSKEHVLHMNYIEFNLLCQTLIEARELITEKRDTTPENCIDHKMAEVELNVLRDTLKVLAKEYYKQD